MRLVLLEKYLPFLSVGENIIALTRSSLPTPQKTLCLFYQWEKTLLHWPNLHSSHPPPPQEIYVPFLSVEEKILAMKIIALNKFSLPTPTPQNYLPYQWEKKFLHWPNLHSWPPKNYLPFLSVEKNYSTDQIFTSHPHPQEIFAFFISGRKNSCTENSCTDRIFTPTPTPQKLFGLFIGGGKILALTKSPTPLPVKVK